MRTGCEIQPASGHQLAPLEKLKKRGDDAGGENEFKACKKKDAVPELPRDGHEISGMGGIRQSLNRKIQSMQQGLNKTHCQVTERNKTNAMNEGQTMAVRQSSNMLGRVLTPL